MSNQELDAILNNPHEQLIYDNEQEEGVPARGQPKGVIILLHGWDAGSNMDPGIAFQPVVDRARQLFEHQGYLVFAPKYNTHESFVFAAKHIHEFLQHSGWPLNNVHMFGYSMGGLVARQLAANGITPRSLVTFCTPNMGTAAWISNAALFNNGAMSMASWSQDLAKLNSNGRDQELRGTYQMIGLSYVVDAAGKDRHYNDGIVEVASAIMWQVSPKPGMQHHWTSCRVGPKPPFEPHGSAQTFPEIQPAFDQFCGLIH